MKTQLKDFSQLNIKQMNNTNIENEYDKEIEKLRLLRQQTSFKPFNYKRPTNQER